MIDFNKDEIFQNSRAHHFLPQKERRVLGELKIEPVNNKLRIYKSSWLRHLTRMKNHRVPKIMLNYITNGRRRLGRLLKTIRRGGNRSMRA
jgi:hypothetical protein